MKSAIGLGLTVVLCLAAPVAHGDGRIYQFDVNGTIIPVAGQNWVSFTSPSDLSSATNDKTVILETAARYVDIIPDGQDDNIPRITLAGGPSAASVQIYLGADQDPIHPDFVSTSVAPSSSGNSSVASTLPPYTTRSSTAASPAISARSALLSHATEPSTFSRLAGSSVSTSAERCGAT